MSTTAGADSETKPRLIQWLFDTRPWFPEITKTSQLSAHPLASRILALLPPSERASALKYYHLRDAKMALASSLLKHAAVTHLVPSTPWHGTTITPHPVTKKPTFYPPSPPSDGTAPPISFNVTHQAGLVALVASPSSPSLPVDVGIDLVCTSERRTRDHDLIGSNSWSSFVDMHADVFSPREASYLKWEVLSAVPGLTKPGMSAADVVDAKLRAFYALWALREAYVKLTGDALLASWLRELEFRGFRPVAPTEGFGVQPTVVDTGNGKGYGAQVIDGFEVRLQGRRVEGVNMSLRAIGEDYMVCSALRTPGREEVGMGWKLGGYRVLDLEEVLEMVEARAEESGGRWEGE